MLHRQIENELAHLERVLPHARTGPFPPSYWRQRLAALAAAERQPLYAARIARLNQAIHAMEKVPHAEAA